MFMWDDDGDERFTISLRHGLLLPLSLCEWVADYEENMSAPHHYTVAINRILTHNRAESAGGVWLWWRKCVYGIKHFWLKGKVNALFLLYHFSSLHRTAFTSLCAKKEKIGLSCFSLLLFESFFSLACLLLSWPSKRKYGSRTRKIYKICLFVFFDCDLRDLRLLLS